MSRPQTSSSRPQTSSSASRPQSKAFRLPQVSDLQVSPRLTPFEDLPEATSPSRRAFSRCQERSAGVRAQLKKEHEERLHKCSLLEENPQGRVANEAEVEQVAAMLNRRMEEVILDPRGRSWYKMTWFETSCACHPGSFQMSCCWQFGVRSMRTSQGSSLAESSVNLCERV